MKFSTVALALMMAPGVFGTGAQKFFGTIEITNLAPRFGNCLTPVWVGVHNGDFDTYNRGEAVSAGMESLCEDGISTTLIQEFAATPGGLWDGVVASGPFCPFEDTVTTTFSFDTIPEGPLYFSYATMILPSNDAFVSNGNPKAHLVLNAAGEAFGAIIEVLGSAVLDAGTEMNDELPANTAFLGQAAPNTGVDENGVVDDHPGFITGGNILTAFTGADFTATDYQVMSIVVTVGTLDTTGSGDGGNSCFSGNTLVDVQGRGDVAMKNLQVGDRVLTGKNEYQPVYAFAHYNENKATDFVKLSHEGAGAPLELSAEHLLYVQGKSRPVRADAVSVGDILVNHSDNVEAAVTKIGKVTRKGFYAPLTEDGSIVVDGVVASTYATLMTTTDSEKIELGGWSFPLADQATFLHRALAPLRMVCRMTASELNVCQSNYDAEGFNAYVSWGVNTIRWAEEQSAFVQVVLATMFFAAFSVLHLLEMAVMGGGEPMIQGLICLVTVSLVVARTNGFSAKSTKKEV